MKNNSVAAAVRSDGSVVTVPVSELADDQEKRGRRWLIWSFIFCPCHLPVTLGILGAIFGGTTFGPVVAENGLAVGVVISAIYAIGVTIGLLHIRAANKDRSCKDGQCSI